MKRVAILASGYPRARIWPSSRRSAFSPPAASSARDRVPRKAETTRLSSSGPRPAISQLFQRPAAAGLGADRHAARTIRIVWTVALHLDGYFGIDVARAAEGAHGLLLHLLDRDGLVKTRPVELRDLRPQRPGRAVPLEHEVDPGTGLHGDGQVHPAGPGRGGRHVDPRIRIALAAQQIGHVQLGAELHAFRHRPFFFQADGAADLALADASLGRRDVDPAQARPPLLPPLAATTTTKIQNLLQAAAFAALVIGEALGPEPRQGLDLVHVEQVRLPLGVAQIDREGQGDVPRKIPPHGEPGAGVLRFEHQHGPHGEPAEPGRLSEPLHETGAVVTGQARAEDLAGARPFHLIVFQEEVERAPAPEIVDRRILERGGGGQVDLGIGQGIAR